MSQSWYVIDPKAPLVFRSGKPFDAGSRDGANFPWPSSLAGLLRTQAMDAQGLQPWSNPEHKQQLLELAAAGPFPAECDGSGRILDVWLPRPADAVLLNDESRDTIDYVRVLPGRHAPGAGSDLPAGLDPVVMASAVKGKPQAGPAWWPLASVLDWAQGKPVSADAIAQRCPGQPWQVERRTHVGIDRDSFAADHGRLFQTEGLDFSSPRLEGGGWHAHRFVLLARGPAGLEAQVVTFGGERRLSWLSPHPAEGIPVPKGWSSKLAQGFALTLATPALFGGGWKPAWLDEHLVGEVPGIPGLKVRLRAAVLDRWQGISGWDLVAQKPRATRKAVAAGATYWFELLAGEPDHLDRLWLAAVSDGEQDRRDGYGIAIPRPWNPQSSGVPHA